MWSSTISSQVMSGAVNLRVNGDCHLLVSAHTCIVIIVNLIVYLSLPLSFVITAEEDQQPLANIPRAMELRSNYLKELYKRRLGMSLKWPPVLITDFVKPSLH